MSSFSRAQSYSLAALLGVAALVLAWLAGSLFAYLLLAITIAALSLSVLAGALSRGEREDRRLVEETLRARERDLRAILESIPGMIAAANSNGEQDFANGRLLDYVGMGLTDSANLGWTDLIHPEERDAVRDRWLHCARTGEAYDVTHRMRRFDGEYRWFHARAEPRLDEQGRVIRWYALIVDVDDRKRAEAALRLSEQQLRLLIDSIPGMVTVTNRAGDIEYANRRVLEFFGADLAELSARAQAAIAHPDEADAGVSVQAGRRAAAITPMDAAYRMRRCDGEYRWIQTRTQPVFDDQGRIIRWYSLLVDIDDRKRAEQGLRKSEHELRLITEAIPVFVWRADPDGAIDYGNKRAVDYTGKNLEDFGGAGWLQLVHPDDVEVVLHKWRHCVATGEPFEFSYRIRGGDGAYRWFQVRAEPARDREGRVIHWYGVCIDIDDRKSFEEALRSTQARLARASQVATLAELSASIAHEINQPLAAAVANGHACQRWLHADPPNVERAQLAAERIIRDATSAADVVGRTRALFKQAALTRSALDLNEVIGEACRLIVDEVSGKNVSIETDLGESLPPAWADRIQMQQVLVNLARNGVDAMESVVDRPRRLLIRSRRDGADRVRVEICDDGTGVADPERIFEPFFTTKHKGMGMGLAICRSIIEAHGGRLWATQNESRGTTFSFALPIRAGTLE